MPNVDTHRQLHELFNRRDWDALGAHLREDVTFTDMARGLTMKSIDDVKGWLGEWATAFSDATGRRMDVAFCEILRYDGDGKVASAEIYYDQLSIMAQLGHVEVPSA